MEPKTVEATAAADSSLKTGTEVGQESLPAKCFKEDMAGLFPTDDIQMFRKIHQKSLLMLVDACCFKIP